MYGKRRFKPPPRRLSNPELNGPGGVLFVSGSARNTTSQYPAMAGSDREFVESATGELAAPASYINICRRSDQRGGVSAAVDDSDITEGILRVGQAIRDINPAVIVALGAAAAHALVPEWPDSKTKHGRPAHRGTIKTAKDIISRRGYWWEVEGTPILATLHPSQCEPSHDPSGINPMLLQADLERVEKVLSYGLQRPRREVEVVSTVAEGERVAALIAARGFAAADIENQGDKLSCLGFATSSEQAYVFAGPALRPALALLESPELTTVWQNAQYDLYYLLTRCGCRVAGPVHDTIVAWHTLWPEIAGKAEDTTKGGAKRTHKMLTRSSAEFSSAEDWS